MSTQERHSTPSTPAVVLKRLVRRRAYEFTQSVPFGQLQQIADRWTARKTAVEAREYAAKLTHGNRTTTYRLV